jgi:hypothetical protein
LFSPIIPYYSYLVFDIDRRPVEIVIDVAPDYVCVTPHAFFHRRYSGVRRDVDVAVAVLTWELVVIHPGMDFMTESYGLYRTLATAMSTEVEKVETQKNNKSQNRQRQQCNPFSHPIYLSYGVCPFGKFVSKLEKRLLCISYRGNLSSFVYTRFVPISESGYFEAVCDT